MGRGGLRGPRRGPSRTPTLAELADRLPPGEEVVLARRVSAAGRSAAFIGGRSAAAADLRALGTRLLSFYGQHEHRKLTLSAAQAEILDGFAGTEHLALRERYRAAHSRVVALAARARRARRSARAPASATSTCSASSSARSTTPRPTPPSTRGCWPTGIGCAMRGRCATPLPPRRLSSPAARRGAGPPARSPKRRRSSPARAASTLPSPGSASGRAPSPWRPPSSAASCAPTWTGSRPTPGLLEETEGRLERDRPAAAQARRHDRGGARARRATAAPSSSGSSAPAGAARSSTRRSRRRGPSASASASS